MGDAVELPPRARRILLRWCQPTLGRGTTSACAENTKPPTSYEWLDRNYLRVRGEYTNKSWKLIFMMELPPRARRIRLGARSRVRHSGTTSACAENTILRR